MIESPDNSKKKRVVITGIGLITPMCIGAESSWEAMCAGRSGISPITRFDTSGMRTAIAGQVEDFQIGDFDDPRFERRFDRFINMAIACSHMAVEDARLEINESNAPAVGVVIGNALGGVLTMEKEIDSLAQEKGKKISPFFVPGTLPNIASSLPAIRLGAKGPNQAVNAACASGAEAVCLGYRMLREGRAQAVIAGGTEAGISPLMFHGYTSMKATSAQNQEPQTAMRPFDKTRDGFVPSEGAGILILETLQSARRRNARIYSEIAGCASTCDAYHITNPDPSAESPVRCMQNALEEAGIQSREIDCINAHGTSTVMNDLVETRAIMRIFGTPENTPAVTANKSMTGHMIGASGAVEAAFSALSIRDGVIPPTINYRTPDPQCPLDYVPNSARSTPVRAVLSNALGFGGANVSLVLREPDPDLD